MANVLIPILHYFLYSVGTTIDIRNYDFGIFNTAIYKQSDVVENSESPLFNATYYVLPDENIPYEKIRVPIDYLLRVKYEGVNSTNRYVPNLFSHWIDVTTRNTDSALVLVVAEYKTSEKSVKENTIPLPSWQDAIDKRQTHYVDKIVHGSRVVYLIRVRSNIPGDVQIFRRILRDIMGTSGTVGPDTVELWKKAEKAIRESSDIRGEVSIGDYSAITNGREVENYSTENVLRYVSEFPKYVITPHDDRILRDPLYLSFQPLHELDERYPSVTKDLEGERYLTKLYSLLKDMDITNSDLSFFLRSIPPEIQENYSDFKTKIWDVHDALFEVFENNLSAYEDINKVAISEAFEQYYHGLDNTTENYLSEFRRVREKLVSGITCGSDFFTPTRGVLRVADDEVVRKGEVENFENCRDFCLEDERCRAVGYSDRECLVYYRSTNSAVITLPRGDSEDTKIYDRKCDFIYDDQ